MGGILDFVIAFVKAVSSSVSGPNSAVLVNVAGSGGYNDASDDEVGEGAVEQEAFGTLGLVFRPRRPDGDLHAEAIATRNGDGLIPFAWRDLRLNKVYSAPKEGSIALVGYGGGFHSIEDTEADSGDRKASTHVIYAPYEYAGDAPKKAHVITLSAEPGNESIAMVHGDGPAVMLTKDGAVIKNAAGDAFIELNAAGITLSGNVTVTGFMVVGAAVPGADLAAKPVMLSPMTASACLKAL